MPQNNELEQTGLEEEEDGIESQAKHAAAYPIYVQLSISLENFEYSVILFGCSALLACYLTFTSLLWLVKDTCELGLVFTAAGLIGTMCSLEFVESRGPNRNRLLKWISILAFGAFIIFDLALFYGFGNLKVATALVGLVLSPVFLFAYEAAVRTTKSHGVGEVMSCSLINVCACVVSAIQHFIVLYFSNQETTAGSENSSN